MGADMKTAEKKWIFSSFNKFDGKPIKTVSDVAETVAHSAMRGDKPELWGVSLDEKDEDGGVLVVCYTGNGPNSEANAHLIAAAPAMYEALKDALEAMQNFTDEHEGKDLFGLNCPNCDGAVPLPHSLGCRIKSALKSAETTL